MSIVLAHCEFEAWFLASARSLADVASCHWISMVQTQPSLAATFDLVAAGRAPSFDKFCRELVRILDVARPDRGSGGTPRRTPLAPPP